MGGQQGADVCDELSKKSFLLGRQKVLAPTIPRFLMVGKVQPRETI